MTTSNNSSKPITVLCYNISFQAMTHNSHGSAGSLGKKCTYIGDTKLTICGDNMANMIDGIPASLNVSDIDLVGLQESSRWYLLQAAAKNTLAKMEVLNTKSGRSEMVSFYNDKRYTLTKNYNGAFSPDRPFQILVLKENTSTSDGVIFINTHHPHGYTFKMVQHHLSQAIATLFLSDEEKQYRVIVVGDFNETGWHWNDSKLDPKSWYPFEEKTGIAAKVSIEDVVYSCCQANGEWSDGQGGVKKGARGGDYIFDSKHAAKISIPPAYDAKALQSDHLPVVAVL